ncbi:MAG: helix-turn-helix transcriptional regulator [Hyphomicrobium sp.]|uniref:helix-turn-helix transcriptional regulator n=1 Tax=Hyphomicrobium sp. TaxID=82 RepID=UPI003D0FCAB6
MATRRAIREDLSRRGIQPGGLSLDEAAAYVGISPNTFLAEVEAGTLPGPLPLKARRKVWSRDALARAIGAADTSPARDLGEEIDKAIDEYAV